MKFFKLNRLKLFVFTIGSLFLRFAVFSIWKPYLEDNRACMWQNSCLDENSDRSLRSNLFNPGIQIAYLWKSLIIYPAELKEIGEIGFKTFKESPVDAFYAVSDFIVHQEKNRTFGNSYNIWHIILLVLYWYLLVCIFAFLLKNWRIVFLVPIVIALLATIYSLMFFREYLSDIMLSFLPYLLAGNVFVFFFSIFLCWKRLFNPKTKKKSKLIILGLATVLVLPAIFSIIFANKYFSFYKPNIIEINPQENPLKILSANIYIYNRQVEELQALITKQDPDLLILTEYADWHEDKLETFLLDNYPFQYERIFSRYPIKKIKNGNKYMQVEVQKDEKKYNLYTIHTTSPMNPHNFISRNNQIKQLASEIKNDIDKLNENIIIVWDFNVTPRSFHYTPLFENFDKNLVNITRANCGIFTRRDARIPFFQSHIDYVWISKNINIGLIEKIKIPGSDHDGFVFDVE